MNKLLKHEFREAARLMLPLLILTFVTGVLTAILQQSSHLPDVFVILSVVLFAVSLMAVAIVALVIVVGRFYENTMKDRAYLTMTLPVSVHGFIWSELLVCLIWAVLTVAALLATFFSIVFITNTDDTLRFLAELPDFQYVIHALREGLEEMNLSAATLVIYALEVLAGILLGFFSYCLRFYVSMAIGQTFAQHKALMSVLAYLALNILMFFLSLSMLNIYDRFFHWVQNMNSVPHVMMIFTGLVDLYLLIVGGCFYGLTAFLLSRKLNLA